MRWIGSGGPCLVLAALLAAQPGVAAEAVQRLYTFNLPAQPLGSALRAFGETCRQDIIFPEGLVRGKRSAMLRGSFTAEEGLHRLLSGTEIAVRRSPSGILSLAPGRGDRTGRQDKPGSGT